MSVMRHIGKTKSIIKAAAASIMSTRGSCFMVFFCEFRLDKFPKKGASQETCQVSTMIEVTGYWLSVIGLQ